MIWLCCSSWKILPFDILRLNAKVLYFIFGLIMGETAPWGRPPYGGDRPQRGFISGYSQGFRKGYHILRYMYDI
jgi:hypothetical protein